MGNNQAGNGNQYESTANNNNDTSANSSKKRKSPNDDTTAREAALPGLHAWNGGDGGGITSNATMILVFDDKSHTPLQEVNSECSELLETLHGMKQKNLIRFLVDKNDFLILVELMKKFGHPFVRRGKDWWKDANGRLHCDKIMTAKNALHECIGIADDESPSSSFRIVSFDLSQMREFRPRPRDIRRGIPNPKSCPLEIQSIPPFLGNLTHLQTLNLANTSISMVPTEIFNGCKLLRVLVLSSTKELIDLPDELGNLSELRELNLTNSTILSLPGISIFAKLQKLEVLQLGHTNKLNPIKDDYSSKGDQEDDPTPPLSLPNLRKLSLRHSALLKASQDAPLRNPNFRKLFFSSQSLVDLDLAGAKNLSSIEDLLNEHLTSRNLVRLDLSATDLSTLPHPSTNGSKFYDGLFSNLKVFTLTSTSVLRNYPKEAKAASRAATTQQQESRQRPALGDLVLSRRGAPLLGCIGLRHYQVDGFAQLRKLSWSLALNRARYRIVQGTTTKRQSENNPKLLFSNETNNPQSNSVSLALLWPSILSEKTAIRLYRPYDDCKDSKNCDCQRLPKHADAVFGLLVSFGNEIFGAPVSPLSSRIRRKSKEMQICMPTEPLPQTQSRSPAPNCISSKIEDKELVVDWLCNGLT